MNRISAAEINITVWSAKTVVLITKTKNAPISLKNYEVNKILAAEIIIRVWNAHAVVLIKKNKEYPDFIKNPQSAVILFILP